MPSVTISLKPGTWVARDDYLGWRLRLEEPQPGEEMWLGPIGMRLDERMVDVSSFPTANEPDWRKTKFQVQQSPLPCEVVLIGNASIDIGPLDDGFQYWFPKSGGGCSAWMLRAIANELDKRNADWERKIEEEMANSQVQA